MNNINHINIDDINFNISNIMKVIVINSNMQHNIIIDHINIIIRFIDIYNITNTNKFVDF